MSLAVLCREDAAIRMTRESEDLPGEMYVLSILVDKGKANPICGKSGNPRSFKMVRGFFLSIPRAKTKIC